MRFLILLILGARGVEAQSAIAFTHVTVVDVARGVLLHDQSVVIQGSRIIASGDFTRVGLPGGTRLIPSKGKFLIPGLWDMHVHEFPNPHVPELFLAGGVTGIRDLYDDQGKMIELRKAIREHRRTGPRVFCSGPTLNGEFEKNNQVVVRTPQQAREAVRRTIKEGMDFVKVYNALPREAFLAVADECKRAGIPFVGHTPDAVTTTEAATAGQRSIEHLDGVLLDSSWNRVLLRREGRFIPDRHVLNSFDPARATQLFAGYARHEIWHCPTLSIYRAAVWLGDATFVFNDPNLRFLPKIWVPKPVKTFGKDLALDRAVLQKMMEVTAMMYRAGVKLLAGTDTGNPYILPGSGLHDELELMVAAGLPVPAVLRIATLAPAQFLGRTHELGSVSAGKLADLVLLDADPLQSIANTRLVRAVVADGVFYDRAALDRLLSAAAADATK